MYLWVLSTKSLLLLTIYVQIVYIFITKSQNHPLFWEMLYNKKSYLILNNALVS